MDTNATPTVTATLIRHIPYFPDMRVTLTATPDELANVARFSDADAITFVDQAFTRGAARELGADLDELATWGDFVFVNARTCDVADLARTYAFHTV